MRLRKTIRARSAQRSPGIDARSDVNADIAINVGERGGANRTSRRQRIVQAQGGGPMSEKDRAEEPKDVSEEELEAQRGEQLPDREAMSLINANVAAPVNAAVALSALSDNSTTIASASQTDDITQTAG
jgi:hypothetical protein